jgi:hypothetical protein
MKTVSTENSAAEKNIKREDQGEDFSDFSSQTPKAL